jgi:SPP1 gp7 family putative phage head morphogenesis protein
MAFVAQFVALHKRIAEEMGKPFRLKRPTIQRFPLSAERGYTSALLDIVKLIRDDINALLLPELKRISQASGLRDDGLHEDTKRRENDLLRNAIRNGTIKKPTKCERCEKDLPLEAHHPSYGKPLVVRWLCRICHERAHGRGLKKDELREDIADVEVILGNIEDQLTARIDNSHLRGLDELVRRYRDQTTAFSRQQTIRQMRRMLGVDAFPTEAGLQAQLDLYLANNAKLIGSMSGDYVNKVMSSVRRHTQAGHRPVVFEALIRKDLKKQFKTVKNKARLIARDQVNKLNGNLTQMRQTGLGIDRYTWRTSRDERVRPSHRVKEGNVYSWDDPPSDTGHPGNDPLCRCSAEPYLEEAPPPKVNRKKLLAKMRAQRKTLRKRLGPKGARKVAREDPEETKFLATRPRPK